MASIHPHYLTFTPQTYHHPISNTSPPMATHPKVLGLTLDPKLTCTHIHNISVQAHNPLHKIKTVTATGWGKQTETLMVTYKAVMRPALEYSSSVWSPLASSTSINKLQVMQNAALRTATGYTQDTNIQHLHDKNSHTSHTRAPTAPRITIQTENTTSITSPTQAHNLLQHSKAKNTIFNNGRYTTNIPTELRTPPPHISSSEEILHRLTLAQLQTNKSPYLNHIYILCCFFV